MPFRLPSSISGRLHFVLFSTRFRTPSLGRTPTSTRRRTLPALRHLALRGVSGPALVLRLVLADGVVCGRGFEGVGLSKYVRNTRYIQMKLKWALLTSPPLSLSAVACSSSGRVDEGSKAAFSVAAAASSEPDLEYSFGSGLRESLSWVSLRAWTGKAWRKVGLRLM
jgi:hypothetical protein